MKDKPLFDKNIEMICAWDTKVIFKTLPKISVINTSHRTGLHNTKPPYTAFHTNLLSFVSYFTCSIFNIRILCGKL